MTSFALHRYAFSVSAACALLAGCGGSQPPMARRTRAQNVFASIRSKHSKFYFTGFYQHFHVPSRVTKVMVIADGGSGDNDYCHPGAQGGLVQAVKIAVPGESLAIFVGGESNGYAGRLQWWW